ncbi:MAG TPA: polyprenol monophosphomannose synthase [Edaphocola sp.]|nr:polyprenol monophosphomannose synthase [Edaphocola sp.]
MKKIVVIPTYNEKENAALIIEAVMQLEGDFHVLIVDDGSPDGTAQIVKQLKEERFRDRLFILERKGKLGLGTAYIAGFKWALKGGYDFIFEMDADFSHNPKDLIRLFEACHKDGADVSVGSRYVKGGKLENWPKDRIFLSKAASFYARVITWMPVKDTTAGFVCYTRKVLEKLPLDEIRFIGYAFQIEMKYRSWKAGFKIKEVPITFTDRVLGSSKMSKGIIKEAVLGVWKMKFFI